MSNWNYSAWSLSTQSRETHRALRWFSYITAPLLDHVAPKHLFHYKWRTCKTVTSVAPWADSLFDWFSSIKFGTSTTINYFRLIVCRRTSSPNTHRTTSWNVRSTCLNGSRMLGSIGKPFNFVINWILGFSCLILHLEKHHSQQFITPTLGFFPDRTTSITFGRLHTAPHHTTTVFSVLCKVGTNDIENT